jgi:hypothetical protein
VASESAHGLQVSLRPMRSGCFSYTFEQREAINDGRSIFTHMHQKGGLNELLVQCLKKYSPACSHEHNIWL